MTTDEPDEQLDPLSPAEEERVRALLADARATGPMPAEVVARLDRSLAGLAAERVALDPEPADNVVPIARTRRHRVVALLGAAAAVVVLGLAVGSFLDQSGDGADDSGAASSDFDRGGAAEAEEDAAAPTQSSEAGSEDTPSTELARPDRAYVVRSRHLSVDLVRIQRLVLPDPEAAVYSHFAEHAPEGFACKSANWGKGVLVAVRYDGDPAYVAFREPMGDAQVADVLQCGTADVLRSTTLPTPG